VSDAEIRALERAVDADPSDAHALEALAAARTRAGRGWADEPLVPDLRCSPRERGVYVWTRHGLGLEMVWVPGEAAFMVGRYPVTAYEEAAWPWSRSGNLGVVGRRDHPVVNVTHTDAVAFCD
jgi:formylglycine-generating enzyme required for sulfatase activity